MQTACEKRSPGKPLHLEDDQLLDKSPVKYHLVQSGLVKGGRKDLQNVLSGLSSQERGRK